MPALQGTAGNRAVNALLARRLGATAHASGENIHFAPGQVNLDEDLLGPELWHARQQRQGQVG